MGPTEDPVTEPVVGPTEDPVTEPVGGQRIQ